MAVTPPLGTDGLVTGVAEVVVVDPDVVRTAAQGDGILRVVVLGAAKLVGVVEVAEPEVGDDDVLHGVEHQAPAADGDVRVPTVHRLVRGGAHRPAGRALQVDAPAHGEADPSPARSLQPVAKASGPVAGKGRHPVLLGHRATARGSTAEALGGAKAGDG